MRAILLEKLTGRPALKQTGCLSYVLYETGEYAIPMPGCKDYFLTDDMVSQGWNLL